MKYKNFSKGYQSSTIRKSEDPTPFRLLMIITTSIFVTETLLMTLMAFMPDISLYARVFLDSLLLTLIIFPLLYYYFFRPMGLHLKELRRLEESLQHSEEAYRTLTDNVPGMVYRGKPDWSTEIISDSTDICGYSSEELMSQEISWVDIIHPDDRERVLHESLELQKNNPSIVQEYRIVDNEGRVLWAEDHKFSRFSKEGNFLGVDGIVFNSTERKQTELARKESEELYKSLLDLSPEAIFVHRRGEILYINQAGADIFGAKHPSHLFGKSVYDLIHPDSLKTVKSRVGQIVKEGKKLPRTELTYLNLDKRAIDVEAIGTYINYTGKPAVLSVIRDITEQKRLEAQLKHSQKMEAIGTLAGGIAHDFNNILSPIMIHSEMAMMELPYDNPVRHSLEEIYRAGERARDMVKQILIFSRKEEGPRAEIKIIPIFKEALKLLRSSIPTTIDIQQNLEVESDTVLADPTQIHQIILNLSTNAAHAMREKGGTLKVDLIQSDFDSEAAARCPDLNPGSYLQLIVNDNGSGIDDETKQNIFEPYFTTKKPGEGTGMGLAVIHGIVKSYGGDITVESEPGKGTTFNVYLPRIEADISPVEEPSVQIPRGTERILFVDDEKVAVEAIKPMLENLGYHVTARTSSIEALEVFKSDPNGFDLVITDQTMPDMTGKDLAQELMCLRSDIPIVLCTGFSEQIDEVKAKEMGISFVMKPFAVSQIAHTIREVLGGS